MVNSLDALCDAVMQFEGWHPGSVSYRNRNPGNLREAANSAGMDERGYCKFDDLTAGYKALKNDLMDKITGRTRTGLGPYSTILDLIRVWAPASDNNNPERYAAFVADYMTKATGHKYTYLSLLSEISPLLPVPAVGIA